MKIALKRELPDVYIEKFFDGLVVYKTSMKPEKIKSLRFLNNSFVLLNSTNESIDYLISEVVRDQNLRVKIARHLPGKRISFRIVVLLENKSSKFDSQKLELLEKKIASPSLFVNRSRPHVEFSFLTRSEGGSFLGLRLTRPRSYWKTLHPGQIKPELASLLCYASEPNPQDVFLDPFSGYGSISVERSHLVYKKIIAGDVDADLVQRLKDKTKHLGKYFEVRQINAVDMRDIPDRSVDKVVTDPPWGIYTPSLDITQLYEAMLNEFLRILKPHGLAIMLVADRELATNYSHELSQFKLEARYNILVSGKKAAIFKFRKLQ